MQKGEGKRGRKGGRMKERMREEGGNKIRKFKKPTWKRL